MKFVAERAFRDTLRQAQQEKAKITVYLESGATFIGYVADAHDHHFIMTELQGREFFDAVIRIQDVSAIEARAR
jgi:hypothetical protein